jgi:hypothetical protein
MRRHFVLHLSAERVHKAHFRSLYKQCNTVTLTTGMRPADEQIKAIGTIKEHYLGLTEE